MLLLDSNYIGDVVIKPKFDQTLPLLWEKLSKHNVYEDLTRKIFFWVTLALALNFYTSVAKVLKLKVRVKVFLPNSYVCRRDRGRNSSKHFLPISALSWTRLRRAKFFQAVQKIVDSIIDSLFYDFVILRKDILIGRMEHEHLFFYSNIAVTDCFLASNPNKHHIWLRRYRGV